MLDEDGSSGEVGSMSVHLSANVAHSSLSLVTRFVAGS